MDPASEPRDDRSSAALRARFPDDVSALGQRITLLRGALAEAVSDSAPAAEALAHLDAAYEKLRVAEEEVRAQQEEIRRLSESQQMLRWQHQRIMQILPVPVAETDRNGVIRSANAATSVTLGVQTTALLNKPLLALIAPEDRPDLRRQLLGMTAGRRLRRTLNLLARDGQQVLTEVHATMQPDDEAITWVFLAVTGRHSGGAGDGDLAAALVRLAALPATGLEGPDLLHSAVDIVQVVLGEGVVVSLNSGSPASPAEVSSSSTLAQAVDGAQIALEEGPCVTAFERRTTVAAADMSADVRWPRFAADPRVRSAGGVIAVPLRIGDELLGALNVYGDVGDPPSGRLVESAELLAAGVAAVLYELSVRAELHDTAGQLSQALTSRATIDQARGMIMADRGCTPEEAFEHLVHLSSTRHVKLRDLARQIVETRSAPGSTRPGRPGRVDATAEVGEDPGEQP